MPKLPELPAMPEIPSFLDLSGINIGALGAISDKLLSHPLIQINKPLLPTFTGFPDCDCPKDCECRKFMNPKYSADNESTYSDKSTS